MDRAETNFTIILDRDELTSKVLEKSTGAPTLSFRSEDDLLRGLDGRTPIAVFLDASAENRESTLALLPQLRKNWPFCPILVMARGSVEEITCKALALGADDVVVKPLKAREVLARLNRRLTDQAQKEAKHSLRFGNMLFDDQQRMLFGTRGKRYLSSTESNLLLCLLQARGTIVDRETLKKRCWGEVRVSDGALDRKIYEVRRAFEEIGGNGAIKTTYGVGFGLELNEAV